MRAFLFILACFVVVIIGCARQAQGKSEFDRLAMEFIRNNEGVRYRAYKDTLGYWTIGVGHLIGKRLTMDVVLTEEQVEELFKDDYLKHLKEAKVIFPDFDRLNDAGKIALVDMTYNIGGSKFNDRKWPNFFGHLKAGRFEEASVSARDSRWCRQVKTRCDKVTDLIKKARYKN